MNFKTTFVLVLILAAVAIYLKFFALVHDPVPKSGDDNSFLVPEAHFMNATHFALKREKGANANIFSSVVVGKSRAGWRLLNPFRFVLKEKVVEDYLVNGLRTVEVVDRFDKDAKAYPGMIEAELEKPASILTFRLLTKDSKHERQMQLHLGRALTAGRYYARLITGTDADEDIYVVRGNLLDRMADMDVESWLQRQLGSPVMSAVKGLRIELNPKDMPAIRITARRQGAGQWALLGKDSDKGVGRGSESAIADYLTKLGKLSTLGFQVEDDPKELGAYGLDEPTMKVAIAASAGGAAVMEDAYQLNIGNKDLSGKAYYANWVIGAPKAPTVAVDDKADGMLNQTVYPQSQVIMRISVKAIDDLKLDENVLRDRRLLSMKEADLKRIQVTRQGIGRDFSYGILKDGNRWRFNEQTQDDYEIDGREISSFIGQLLGLAAESFSHELIDELKKKPADKRPGVEIKISDYLGRKSMLRLNPLFDLSSSMNAHAKKWLVQTPMDPTNYVIGESQLQRLILPPLTLKQRMAMEIGLDKVARIVLKREDDTVFDFEKSANAKGNWALKGYQIYDPKKLSSLLRQLQSLRVAQWLPAESIGDAEEAITSELHLHTTSGVIDIRINALNGLGQIGLAENGVLGDGITLNTGAFKATPQLLGLMRDEYRLKPLIGVGAEKLQLLALMLGQDTVHIRRSERGVFSSPQLKGMDQKAAARLFDLTAGLTAIRYVDLKPSLTEKLINGQTQTQLQVQLVDGRHVLIDVVGKASSLMSLHPELKPFAGIRSWVLARVIGRIPVIVSKEKASGESLNTKVTWCLLPDKALDQLLGMTQ